MLEIHVIDGINCPVLVCDICGERLLDASKSAVVFNNFAPNGTKAQVLHVHKGSIDGKTCHQNADALISKAGGNPGWQELKACLTDLAHNVGFTPAEQVGERFRRR